MRPLPNDGGHRTTATGRKVRKSELIRPAHSPLVVDDRTLAIKARALLRGETPRPWNLLAGATDSEA